MFLGFAAMGGFGSPGMLPQQVIELDNMSASVPADTAIPHNQQQLLVDAVQYPLHLRFALIAGRIARKPLTFVPPAKPPEKVLISLVSLILIKVGLRRQCF